MPVRNLVTVRMLRRFAQRDLARFDPARRMLFGARMATTILPPADADTEPLPVFPRHAYLADLRIPRRVNGARRDAFECLERRGARVFLEIDGHMSVEDLALSTGLGRRRVIQELTALAYAGLVTYDPAF